MMYIGIDPRKNGAIAVIGDGGITVAPFSEPAFRKILCGLWPAVAVVEDVHAMPGQGVTSMFSFGYNKGWICGMLYTYGIPVEMVSPRKWKSFYGLGHDKRDSIGKARSLYPEVNLLKSPRCRKEHDGMAEALLLADYCKRTSKRPTQ